MGVTWTAMRRAAASSDGDHQRWTTSKETRKTQGRLQHTAHHSAAAYVPNRRELGATVASLSRGPLAQQKQRQWWLSRGCPSVRDDETSHHPPPHARGTGNSHMRYVSHSEL